MTEKPFREPSKAMRWEDLLNPQPKTGEMVPVDDKVDVKGDLEQKAWEERQRKAAAKWEKRMERVESQSAKPQTKPVMQAAREEEEWCRVERTWYGAWKCIRCGHVSFGRPRYDIPDSAPLCS